MICLPILTRPVSNFSFKMNLNYVLQGTVLGSRSLLLPPLGHSALSDQPVNLYRNTLPMYL